MDVPFYLIDAFAHDPFTGNPAGVCLCSDEPGTDWMQKVAWEINQAETAFVWPVRSKTYGLRWFTPTVEVDLCGHATLASYHALGEEGNVTFETESGNLTCWRTESKVTLDFPVKIVEPQDTPRAAQDMFLGADIWFGKNDLDWFVEFKNEDSVLSFQPDHTVIASLGCRGMVITAPANTIRADFISRFFAPGSGVPEDFVTGSAHCALAPFWSERLGKTDLVGYQASQRGGFVEVGVRGGRVWLSGSARTVVSGTLSA